MKIGDSNVELKWLGHSSVYINNSKVIYIDPYNLQNVESLEKADLVFLTHSHYDHCSILDIEKIIKDSTTIVLTPDCQSKVTRIKIPVKIFIMEPNQETSFGEIKVSTIPSYNIDKHFHPKEENWVGYIIKMEKENVVIYHSGDTDNIPEMQKLTGYSNKDLNFVALLPVGGRYTMTAEEAAEAAKVIKPSLAIPMHYGSVAGTLEDAKEFVELCEEKGIKAMVLEKG